MRNTIRASLVNSPDEVLALLEEIAQGIENGTLTGSRWDRVALRLQVRMPQADGSQPQAARGVRRGLGRGSGTLLPRSDRNV